MNLYLTFDHYYSGIIQSQVVDVVEYLEAQGEPKLKIISFVNIRTFLKARQKFKRNCPRVIVLPNFGFSRWHWSLLFLLPYCLIYRPKKIVGRSMFATQLALKCRKLGLTREVSLDSRGAEYAEWKEYFFPNDEGPLKHLQIFDLEKEAIASSDQQLAVSKALIEFWNEEFKINPSALSTVIVPSTLARSFSIEPPLQESEKAAQRRAHGIPEDAIVLIFSGSSSDWHGMDKLLQFSEQLIKQEPRAFCVFLSNQSLPLDQYTYLASRSLQTWLKQEEVADFLRLGDYGLLLREPSNTNKVASPVKFAEYLACGLHVLISESIGDLSTMVHDEGVGAVVKNYDPVLALRSMNVHDKLKAQQLAERHFTKEAHRADYLKLFY